MRRAQPSPKAALVHEMLERVADTWTLLVIDALDSRTELRFSRQREQLGGVSQKMLTKTLRQLERDGLVARARRGEVAERLKAAVCQGNLESQNGPEIVVLPSKPVSFSSFGG